MLAWPQDKRLHTLCSPVQGECCQGVSGQPMTLVLRKIPSMGSSISVQMRITTPWSEISSFFGPQNATNWAADSFLLNWGLRLPWWLSRCGGNSNLYTNPSFTAPGTCLLLLGRQLKFGHGFILQLLPAMLMQHQESTEATELGAGLTGHSCRVMGNKSGHRSQGQSQFSRDSPGSHRLSHPVYICFSLTSPSLAMNYRATGGEVASPAPGFI